MAKRAKQRVVRKAKASAADKRLEKTALKVFIGIDARNGPPTDTFGYNWSTGTYDCALCAYRSAHVEYARQHSISHSSEQPYVCRECGQKYKRMQHLRRHVRIVHFGVKPYRCDACGKCMTQSQTYRDHIRLHSIVEKAFVCGFNGCAKRFKLERYLSYHKKRVHKIKPNSANGEPIREQISEDIRESSVGQTTITASVTDTNDSQMAANRNRFVCRYPNCGQLFERELLLRDHIKTHKIAINESNERLATKSEIKGIYNCNIENCVYRTLSFDKIAEHFATHWETFFL